MLADPPDHLFACHTADLCREAWACHQGSTCTVPDSQCANHHKISTMLLPSTPGW